MNEAFDKKILGFSEIQDELRSTLNAAKNELAQLLVEKKNLDTDIEKQKKEIAILEKANAAFFHY